MKHLQENKTKNKIKDKTFHVASINKEKWQK